MSLGERGVRQVLRHRGHFLYLKSLKLHYAYIHLDIIGSGPVYH